MKNLVALILLFFTADVHAQTIAENYPVDSASVEHRGVPKGEVLKFTFANSKIYPGTWREYSVYIPAEYDPAKPACVFIDQDGVQFKSPTVFDNLIFSKEMPVTIGVYITPGRVIAKDTTALDRYNRSFEFDALGDAYARFVLEELLPDVEKHKASNGRPIVLSHSGNDRMIAGTSSGAICAFTAAWERPDAFSRVFSGIGTYVSLRGGDRYPSLIRKYEPKPIKVFLQDGSHDQNAYGGDWFYANQMMERALSFAGYQVNHAWGEGAHNSNQATAVFPEAMRWLWKGYPAPIDAGKSKNPFLDAILVDGEGWKIVDLGSFKFKNTLLTDLISDNKDGLVHFKEYNNRTALTFIRHDNGEEFISASPDVSTSRDTTKKYTKMHNPTFKSRLAKANTTWDVSIYDVRGIKLERRLFQGNDIVFSETADSEFYLTGADGSRDSGRIFLVKDDYSKTVVDYGLNSPYGLAFTPDHSQLYVTEENSHWVWLFNIKPDGTLTNKQRYGWLHSPDTSDNAQARGIKVDCEGRVYVATNLGIQVLDQTGRVNCILPLPLGAGPATSLCFGGKGFNVLYVICGDKMYKRKLKTKGMNDFDQAVKPIKPRL